jgi:CDP-diacylglycerol--serine O-phosphatidyltransferase
MDHNLERAAVFILLAGIFDMLDGVVARLVKSTSEFGVELDSLCDAVSFGLAPSVMLWVAFLHEWLNWGLLLASLPALAAVLRLARFNVQLTSLEDKVYFRGMPVPAGAFTIVSYLIFSHNSDWVPVEFRPYVLVSVVVIVSAAMVSTIKYDNLPRPTAAEFRRRPVVFMVFLAAIVASVLTQGKAIFPFMVLYLIVGAVRHAMMLMKNGDDSEEMDTLEEPDPDPFSM